MFSSHKSAMKSRGDGYDDEQHLVAAVSEFKKVDSSSQNMIDQLHQRLASPFQITTKPCEVSRATVLQCYQRLQSSSESTASDTPSSTLPTAPAGALSDSKGPSADPGERWLSIPYQRCYEAAAAYRQCVEAILAKHAALVADFEEGVAQRKVMEKAPEKSQ
ncbi:hypothetical protein JKF63_01084 [Porcisia hertigi]|uniref:Uncharacterized protein n=1 Tax=Porcisia hertigi TaxID=2761500 RepID=A0A836I8N9_9TRYP|nr:hypothetical protein JKF63_01084 [Porcisia hertigi]